MLRLSQTVLKLVGENEYLSNVLIHITLQSESGN